MKGPFDVKTPREYVAKLEEPRRSEIKRIDKLIRQDLDVDALKALLRETAKTPFGM